MNIRLLVLLASLVCAPASAQIQLQKISGSNVLSAFSAPVVWPATALRLQDTNATHSLILTNGSDLTANRTFTLVTGDADRTLTLTGNISLSDWFDQSVKTTAGPTFVTLTLSGGTADTLVYLNGSKAVASVSTGASLSLSGGTLNTAQSIVSGAAPTFLGTNFTALNATNLSTGTVPNAQFPATLPAVSGASLTNLNGSAVASGTVPAANLGSGSSIASKFLRGDNSWQTLPGGGNMLSANNLGDVANSLTSINNLTASGAADSYRFGTSSLAAGIRALAIGSSATAPGQGSISIGDQASSTSNDNTAVGYRVFGGLDTSVAIGSGAHAGLSGSANVFVGDDSKAYDFVASPSETTILATAVGRQSVSHRWGVAAGNAARARGISSIAIGKDSLVAYTHTDSIVIGNTATSTAASQMRVGSNAHQINSLYFNDAVATAPQDFTMGWASATGSNIAGKDVYFTAPASTGNTLGGSFIWQTSAAGSSGTGANAAATRATLNSTNLLVTVPITSSGALSTTSSAPSTSVSTGALIVNNLFAVSGLNGTVYGSGIWNNTNTTASSSTTAGSVVFSGGIAVAKDSYFGGIMEHDKDQTGLTTVGGARVIIMRNTNGAANERQEIGFGNGGVANQSSALIGSQIISGAGSTNANFYVATRSATTDTAPTIRLSIAETGEATFTSKVSVSNTAATFNSGTGSPESVVTAPVGSIFTRTDGGANTTLYIKESGAGNTGWVAK